MLAGMVGLGLVSNSDLASKVNTVNSIIATLPDGFYLKASDEAASRQVQNEIEFSITQGMTPEQSDIFSQRLDAMIAWVTQHTKDAPRNEPSIDPSFAAGVVAQNQAAANPPKKPGFLDTITDIFTGVASAAPGAAAAYATVTGPAKIPKCKPPLILNPVTNKCEKAPLTFNPPTPKDNTKTYLIIGGAVLAVGLFAVMRKK